MIEPQQNKVVQLDVNVVVDTKAPIEALGGSKSLYYTMLKRMDQMSLESCVVGLVEAVENNDYDRIKQCVH